MQDAAWVSALLEGVKLPAPKRELLDYARRQDGGGEAAALLERVSDREYASLDEVGEELRPVQPPKHQPLLEQPRDESGEPPGGDEYTNPNPEPGEVRETAPPDNPPQKQIEEAAALRKEQQAKQEED